jgi:hypothetical protein
MKTTEGRPKALDKTGLARIKSVIISSPGIARETLKATIAEEYHATAGRRRQDPDSLKPLSARSLKRYLDLFFAFRDLVTSTNYSSLAELLNNADDLPLLHVLGSPPILG